MPTLRINLSDENKLHFITFTVIEWIDIFTKPEYFKIIIDSFKFCRKNKGLLLFEGDAVIPSAIRALFQFNFRDHFGNEPFVAINKNLCRFAGCPNF